MNLRLRLSIRMLLFIVSAAAVVFFTTVRIISQNFKKVAYEETMETNQSQAKKYASEIQMEIEEDFNQIRAYKQIVEGNSVFSFQDRRPLFDKTLVTIVENSNYISSAWDTWELRFLKSNWDLPYGCVTRKVVFDDYNTPGIHTDSTNLEGEDEDSFYYACKQRPVETTSIPKRSGENGNTLETSIMVPLNINKQFAGLVGADIQLGRFQQYIEDINAKQSFKIMLMDTDGNIIAHENKKLVGLNIELVDTFLIKRFNVVKQIQIGNESNYNVKDINENDSIYYSLVPFKIGNTNSNWAILIIAPLDEIELQLTSTITTLKNSILAGLIIIALVVLIFALSIIFPIRKTRNILIKLGVGDVHSIDKLPVKTKDEMGEMAHSLNTVVVGLNEVTEFAENIGAGNYDYNFEMLSDDDTLGQAVIEMRNSLKKARQEEDLRREHEQQLEWASQGMNIFNKVLRVDDRNLEELSYEIIKSLTTYLDAHMGGLYVKTELGEVEFELVSFIGFNKEKYEKKYIQPEDGIVGQCILEKETIFINDVPKDFDVIISGLGNSTPRSVLVVPLLNNRVLIGMIEIESLGEIQKHQVDFVERISETIASTVSNVQTNVRTAQLLDKAQKQAEELEQQEEEMRQNMEEMQATQEEASKVEAELSNFIEGFNKIMPVIEYDKKGKVIDVNDNYLKLFKAKKNQIVGKKHKADLFMNETELANHKEFWNNLSNGIVAESLGYIKSGKDDYWLIEKFLPIKDQYGLVQKILCVGIDITEQKKAESRIKQIKEGIIQTKGEDQVAVNPIIDLNHELKTIDLTYLKMVYKKDPAKIYNILKLYYDTLPSQVNELQTLAAGKDFVKLKSKINSLKTKMSYLGLKMVYEQLREIEKLLAEQKNLIEIPKMMVGINRQWMLAYEELMMLLKIY